MESKKILIIDDDFSVRETLCDILKAQGYDLVEAANGAEACARVKESDFDCVIVDLRLPDATGIEIIEKISDKVPKNRIVVITGYASNEVLSNALTDADFFLLLKPVDPEQMIEVVKKIAG